MSNQGERQASARAIGGTTGPYNEDFMAMFTADGVPEVGTFNERFLQWLNIRLSRVYTNLPEAMTAFAEAQGVSSWNEVGALGATAGPTAPNYLATVSSSPYAAVGSQRVVSAHSGPLIRLRRADGAEQDFGTGTDYPDNAAIAAWSPAAIPTVKTLYDQTGGGRDFMQTTVANQPLYDAAIAVGNVVPITFSSEAASVFMEATGWTLDRIAYSIFGGFHGISSYDAASLWSFTSADGVTTHQDAYTASGRLGTVYDPASSPVFVSPTQASAVGYQHIIRPRALGWTNSAAATAHYANQTTVSGAHAAQASLNYPRFVLGKTSTNNNYNQFALFSLVVYPATLNSTDGLAVTASIRTAHGFAPLTGFDYSVVFSGDSIMQGPAPDPTGLRNMPTQLLATFTKNVKAINTGVSGQTQATIYSGRVARFAASFVSGTQNVIFLQGGSNDIKIGTTGANTYNNSTALLITYVKSLGFKVVVCTPLDRTDIPDKTELDAYRALVLANSAGADYVLDLYANPTMGGTTATADTTLYADGVHPTTLGHAYLAGAPSGIYANTHTYYHALQEVLRAAIPDAGYVP